MGARMAILKYTTPDGDILIEIADNHEKGQAFRTKGYDPNSSKQAADKVLEAGNFDAVIGRVRAVGNSVARAVKSIDVTPETAEVELLMKFNADAGVIFASAGAEAQMKVKLSWKPQQEPKSKEGDAAG